MDLPTTAQVCRNHLCFSAIMWLLFGASAQLCACVCVNLSACVWACGVSVDAVPVWVGRGYLVSSGSQEHITYIRCIPAVSVSVTEEQGHELMEQNNILKRLMLLKDPRRHQNHPRVPANSLNGALVETETSPSPSHMFILQGFKTII